MSLNVLTNGNSNDNALPLVSVIIPSYNHAKYIDKTILSIINQIYKNIELIIIDDGSTDNTRAVISALKNKCYSRFRKFFVKYNKNKGIINSLNEALKISIGEFIYIIASDDIAEEEAILKLVDVMRNNNEIT